MQYLSNEACGAWRTEHARRRTWKRQKTWVVSAADAQRFAAALLDVVGSVEAALLQVDVVVFAPRALTALRAHAPAVEHAPGHLFTGDTTGLVPLLVAALRDAVDGRVLWSPDRHAARFDHDDRVTVFSQSPGWLAELAGRVGALGIPSVEHHASFP